MKCRIVIGIIFASLAVLCIRDSSAGDAVKIKPTVTFARTWEAAVQEAKDLNLPLVIHSHGFY